MPVADVSCASLAPPAWLNDRCCPFSDTLAVFCCYLPDHATELPRLDTLLTPKEQARAARYRLPADRNRFVAGRGLLRLLAGRYTKQSSEQVTINPGRNQKPMLTNAPGWHVNLTHAGEWVLLAVGRVAVGIDVEEMNPDFRYADLLTTAFGPDEQEQIRLSEQPRRQFYDGWTRKEALLKATGHGLSDELTAVPCLDGEHRVPESVIGAAGSWIVRSFALSETYRAAVAYEAQAEFPRFYTIETGFIARLRPTLTHT